MARKRPPNPLAPPELLSAEDMQRFRDDPNFRAERRAARLMAMASPAGGVAIRGYRRDWLFDGEVGVPKPDDFDKLLAQAIREKNSLTPPLTDKITAKYDIFPYEKAAKRYGQAQNRKYAARVSNEVHDPAVMPNFRQGIERNLIYAHDSLQWNLWLKKSIADWRLAYINTFLHQIEAGLELDDDAVRHTAGAVADVGYCLRRGEGLGLLKHLGQGETTAQAIEHIGQYAASGHPETLISNMDLVLLARDEQEKRVDYWGSRVDATYQAFGNCLSDEDRSAQADLDLLLQQLYSQIEVNEE